jgi:hypothetical protein
MLYQSPADFCAEYAEAHNRGRTVQTPGYIEEYILDELTVVGETSDTTRVEALWRIVGHEMDSGYYDGLQRTAFVLVKRHDGWHLQSEEFLGYE